MKKITDKKLAEFYDLSMGTIHNYKKSDMFIGTGKANLLSAMKLYYKLHALEGEDESLFDELYSYSEDLNNTIVALKAINKDNTASALIYEANKKAEFIKATIQELLFKN